MEMIYEIDLGKGVSVGLTWHDERQSDPATFVLGDENLEHLECTFWLKEYLQKELKENEKRHGGISLGNDRFCRTKDILKNGWPFYVFLRRVFKWKMKLVEGGIPSFGPEVPDDAIL